jgi:hypothetical protein
MGLLRRKKVADPIPFDELQPGEQEIVLHFDALVDRLVHAVADSAEFYVGLAPDGRELDAGEAADAQRWLGELARIGRTLDRERDLVAEVADGGFDMRPTIALIQSIKRSLVLALSESPERRARAIPVPELQARAQPVYVQLKELHAQQS